MKGQCYKVVRDNGDGIFTSRVAKDACCLKYKIGRTTKAIPHSPGLFVFKDLYDAKNFACQEGTFYSKVLICTYEGKLYHRRFRPSLCDLPSTVRELLAFFRKKRKSIEHTPAGTYTVKAVKPIKVVESWRYTA